ncbi:MAG: hypothetical protein BWY47_01523 [Bacteroidetes bacterium ADurb.Bin302]|jgi:hypothetical protein|nr:MAG: hypothetical protein BWY47_01523 [Bacteroidetes bacterium ADurb.Bin302]
MAKRIFKFKMTATITQFHLVEIEEDDVPDGQEIEEYAQEEANETWDYTQSETNESFSQDSKLVSEVTNAEYY